MPSGGMHIVTVKVLDPATVAENHGRRFRRGTQLSCVRIVSMIPPYLGFVHHVQHDTATHAFDAPQEESGREQVWY